jgi:hypothetical protein
VIPATIDGRDSFEPVSGLAADRYGVMLWDQTDGSVQIECWRDWTNRSD